MTDYSSGYPATDPTGHIVRPTASPGLMLSGRYRLEALLASSHKITTWRANDNVLSRPVLMHLLTPDDARMGWVMNAARRAATINDARFLRVLDALEATGQEPWSFVVSEFAVGDSLETLLAKSGPLAGEQASYIVAQMASALAPLHARGMFHLRINPSAGIVTVNGNIKIVGFLIDAALRPKPGEAELNWADQELIDCHDLALLLYSLTTAHWPVPPDEPQRSYWGLPAAPLRLERSGASAGEQLWASPHEINPAISPTLSAVIMAALRPRLGLVGPGLHSANDIADSLEGLSDPLEAEDSLEALMRSSDAPTEAARIPPLEAIPAPAPRPTVTPQTPNRPTPVAAPPPLKPRKTQTAALGRKAVVLLITFILLALVVLQIRGCEGDTDPQAADEAAAEAIQPAAIVSVFDFDPSADGGDNDENSDQAIFAADGDPATAWQTLTYLNNPAFGGLKPGAGIVYDLGEAVPVAGVRVLLDNEPAALQLMVPIENDASAASPPMNTVSEWQVIASDEATSAEVLLEPEDPVVTRWLLVYFTSLPSIGANQYRSGIAETYINE